MVMHYEVCVKGLFAILKVKVTISVRAHSMTVPAILSELLILSNKTVRWYFLWKNWV